MLELEPAHTLIEMGFGVTGIEIYGRLIAQNGRIEPLEFLQGISPVEVGLCKARAEGDGNLATCNGFFKTKQFAKGHTAVGIRGNIAGV